MTDEDRQDIAFRLQQRGLKQSQIARTMGITRESVCRMLQRRQKRIERLRELCLKRGECGLVQMLLDGSPAM